MRVLFISFDFAELSVRLASALTEYVDVCLMIPRAEAKPFLKWLDPKVIFEPFDKPRLRQPLLQLRLMKRLICLIKRFNPDLIHLQKGHLYFNLCLPQVRRYPLVVSIHDPDPHVGDTAKTPPWALNFGRRRARQVIAHNDAMKDMIIHRLRIPANRISVVPLVECGDATAALNVEEAGHEILFYGRIWKYKGLEYLIRAQPLIARRIPEAKIVIAGHGEDFARYRSLMADPKRFEVHNEYVPEDKQAELFRRASVVALPYIEATQSGVIPLAYTFGKPVVATTVGGLPSQVDDGRTGFLVPPRDVEALADKIVLLLQDRALRHRLGANGREKLVQQWSAGVVARQTVQVYHEALRRAAAPSDGEACFQEQE
jgi:glycosyltransferase involved in cell wall biosynthesis